MSSSLWSRSVLPGGVKHETYPVVVDFLLSAFRQRAVRAAGACGSRPICCMGGILGCGAGPGRKRRACNLEESAEHATGFSETVCFEAYYEESGEWFVPAESELIMENYRERELPICLSLVNDVQMDDGSIVQKSKDFLTQTLLTEAARSGSTQRTYRENYAVGSDIPAGLS